MRVVGLAAMLAAGATAARAATVTGPYVSLGGGYNIEQDQSAFFARRTINGYASDRTYRWSDGFTGQGSAGYGFGNGLRIEVEGDDYGNSINNRVRSGVPNATTGNDNMYGVMVNALYDIDLARFGIALPVTPYLGVGVGYQWDHLSPLTTVTAPGVVGAQEVSRVGGTEGNFAYQGIVGVAYDIRPVPGLAATLEYRFLGTDAEDNRFTTVTYVGRIGRTGPAYLNDSFNHSFLVGLRYAFNTASPPLPPAPVTAAPAPAASRTYLVFFDWDRAVLTPRADQIVAEAAHNSTRVQTTMVEVDGYADTSHALPGERGQAYNLRLSLRRADAVRAALIRDGVPAGVISVHGYGDTHLLVPTGPDVREPQNRRVEIVLR